MFDALESEQYGTSLGRENGTMILYAMAVGVINENCCYRDPLGVFRTVSAEWDVSWKSISYGEILIVVCDGWRVRLPRCSELEDAEQNRTEQKSDETIAYLKGCIGK